jgi:hypothetical protein
MGVRDLLHELAGAGLSVSADGDALVVRPASKLTDEMRRALVQAKPELLVLLAPENRPYRLAPAQGDAAHAEPWDDATIARFVARVGLFLRARFDATDADDLAETLTLRDREGTDKAMCLECCHLAGSLTTRWRCSNARAAGIGADLPTERVTTLQHCRGFADR